MYNKINHNTNNINSGNNIYLNMNNIFKQVNANIMTNHQRRKSSLGLNQRQHNVSCIENNSNLNNNYNRQLFLNGTIENEDVGNQTLIPKINQNNSQLNRYNSFGRMKNLKSNCNENKIPSRTKKEKINKTNKFIPSNNQNVIPKNKKNVFIPLGTNKYRTIGEANCVNYYNYNTNYRANNKGHNTIEANNLNLGNQMMLKKYNLNRPNNYNYNNNYNYSYKNKDNSYYKNAHSPLRPKTPDHQKKERSSFRKPKTPDRQRTKMRLNYNKDYICPTMENTTNYHRKSSNYNYGCQNNNDRNRGYNTIDNYFDNTYHMTQENGTNDYFKHHKKAFSNYYPVQLTTNNNNTLTSNNSNINPNKARKSSCGKINNNNKYKQTKTLSKNASQGNIHHNNYIYGNCNNNNIYNNYYTNPKSIKNKNQSNNNNVKTPVKFNRTHSNYSGSSVPVTQTKNINTYGIYEDTFQSFGKNIPHNFINNNIYKNQSQKKLIENKTNKNFNNNINMNNNKAQTKQSLQEQGFKYNQNNKPLSSPYSNDILSSPSNIFALPRSNDKASTNNYNKYNYIPKNFSSLGSEMMSGSTTGTGSPGNYQLKEFDAGVIDFNELDQFSPPYTGTQVNLANNIDLNKNAQLNNQYTNIGLFQEGTKGEANNHYNLKFTNCNYNYSNKQSSNINNFVDNNNRKVIDDFINQLNTKRQNFL